MRLFRGLMPSARRQPLRALIRRLPLVHDAGLPRASHDEG